MGTSTIRKAIGAVKDKTSISLAKVSGYAAPDLEVLILKATTHEDEPADDKYVREILSMMSCSRGYVNACVFAISKRLSKTNDWIVALKALMLVHKLLNDGDPVFGQEMMLASRKGARVLSMSDFRDAAHSDSWFHSRFVKTYALYLHQKLKCMVNDRKLSAGDDGDGDFNEESGYGMDRKSRSSGDLNEDILITKLSPDRVVWKLNQSFQLLKLFLACRPAGDAENTRMVLIAFNLLVKESFTLYTELSNVLEHMQECMLKLEQDDLVMDFDTYVNVAKIIDELINLYNWYKDIGLMKLSEFPEVQATGNKLLTALEGLVRREKDVSSSEIKALPPPPPPPEKNPNPPQPKKDEQVITEDLVNLKDDGLLSAADQQGNNMALALFSTPASSNTNNEWIPFPKADWELALVESASKLSNQKADLAGGFDTLLLNGMYDQGTVREHMNKSQASSGSGSSVALAGALTIATQVLALPAPDGTIQPVVGQQDPFAASLTVPPPSYVQIADMEKKQQLLIQEQHAWQQYASMGMKGQLGNIVAMPHTGLGQPAGYHYTSY